MSAEHVEARLGAYADSVTLMRVSADVRQADGVQAALIAMATELNLDLLAAMGFPPPDAGSNHLLIAVRASDDAALAGALAVVETALTARPGAGHGTADHWAANHGVGQAQLPRTTAAAVRASGPGLALISVPGRYAFAEAMDALQAGCDVMIFSDNVPVEQEIMLKDFAAERDLIVMGPDCGTAMVGGVGLGFSHTLAAGPVGIVAASGTGAQQVMCLLDYAGAGVSAALGVGGRDLSAAVGGRSARAALAALDVDPGTELIIMVSKPPAAEVAAHLRDFAARLATPVQFALVGPGEPDLTAATESALRTLGQPVPDWPRWPGQAAGTKSGGLRADLESSPRAGVLRGLFSGGTLCDEAMVIASDRLGPIRSNIPLRPELRLAPRGTGTGHAMIDFGDDELTMGRAHPMIDQSLRLERLAAEAADPAVTAVLLDVVLGHGAHPDPAAELAPAIAEARASGRVSVVVSLIGAAADPQGLGRQAAALQAAGAEVFASNAAAARFACDLIEGAR
ncbi:MAG TPA: FdrA family protein [Streptosporangiaceae bacterium]|jgi:FdrA protein|nr:FdrA family protein [Streptosporangiaceae bacterium]